MQQLTNTRGTLRTMKIGERYCVPFSQMAPDNLRTQAGKLKMEGHGTFSVSVDRSAKVSTVTRTA